MADTSTLMNLIVKWNLLLKMKTYIRRPVQEQDMVIIFTDIDHADQWEGRIENSKVYTAMKLIPIPSNYEKHLLDEFIAHMSDYMKTYFKEHGRDPRFFFFDSARPTEKPLLHLIIYERHVRPPDMERFSLTQVLLSGVGHSSSWDLENELTRMLGRLPTIPEESTESSSSPTPTTSPNRVQFSLFKQSCSESLKSDSSQSLAYYASLLPRSSILLQTSSGSVKYNNPECSPTSSPESGSPSRMCMNYRNMVDVSFPLESSAADDRTTIIEELPIDNLVICDVTLPVSEESPTDSRR